VRSLIDLTLPAGAHVRSWNLDDETGRPAAPGVYFVELAADGTRRVARLNTLPR
jgi:hypothetical protein